jgi:hypothetical protein
MSCASGQVGLERAQCVALDLDIFPAVHREAASAVASAELDAIVAACQQAGLGQSSCGTEGGALVVNLFAAHALMVRVISCLAPPFPPLFHALRPRSH